MTQRAKSQRPVVLAFTSDQHCGGTTALCPPRIDLDDGGEYAASKAQRWILQCWHDYWTGVAKRRSALGADLYAVFGGDLVEGDHHRTTQILSGNLNAQAAVVDAVMAVPLALNPDRLFFVRGTEAHVGNSASTEERIATGLRKDHRPVVGDPETGKASWWHLRMEIHGRLLDVTHHGRTGQREHTRAGAAALHAHDVFLSHAKRGERAPDLCLRAHYHRFNDSHDACPTRVVTSGAWQLKTSHVYKVAADNMADIGGLVVVIHPDGRYDVEKIGFRAERGPVWRA
jgi:hypothetical protein